MFIKQQVMSTTSTYMHLNIHTEYVIKAIYLCPKNSRTRSNRSVKKTMHVEYLTLYSIDIIIGF